MAMSLTGPAGVPAVEEGEELAFAAAVGVGVPVAVAPRAEEVVRGFQIRGVERLRLSFWFARSEDEVVGDDGVFVEEEVVVRKAMDQEGGVRIEEGVGFGVRCCCRRRYGVRGDRARLVGEGGAVPELKLIC